MKLDKTEKFTRMSSSSHAVRKMRKNERKLAKMFVGSIFMGICAHSRKKHSGIFPGLI